MIRRPPRSTLSSSSAASDVYKRQLDGLDLLHGLPQSLDQMLDHRALKTHGAHHAGGLDHQPSQLPKLPPVLLRLHAARDGLQLLPALEGLPAVSYTHLTLPT